MSDWTIWESRKDGWCSSTFLSTLHISGDPLTSLLKAFYSLWSGSGAEGEKRGRRRGRVHQHQSQGHKTITMIIIVMMGLTEGRRFRRISVARVTLVSLFWSLLDSSALLAFCLKKEETRRKYSMNMGRERREETLTNLEMWLLSVLQQTPRMSPKIKISFARLIFLLFSYFSCTFEKSCFYLLLQMVERETQQHLACRCLNQWRVRMGWETGMNILFHLMQTESV